MTGDQLDQQVRDYFRHSRRRTVLSWAIAVSIVLALLGLGYLYAQDEAGDKVDSERAAAVAKVQERLDKVEGEYETLYEDFEECVDRPANNRCDEPVTLPPEQLDDDRETPRTVVRVESLSRAAIDAAVVRFCKDTGQCEGKDAKVSAAMVSAAVSAYCDARGQCTPPPPKDGVDGKDAPPPTDEQVQASVAAYCAANGCSAPEPGPVCPDGFHGEVVTVLTSLTTEEEIFACRRDA